MKRWSVSIPWHAEVIVKVEAEDEESAVEQAYSKANPSACVHCRHIQLSEANEDCKPSVEEIKN